MTMNEYRPRSAFTGVIGRTVEESAPAWPEPKRAREGAPNVLFVVIDDTGAPVCPDVEPPFEFPGVIHSATYDVTGDLIEDDEATLRADRPSVAGRARPDRPVLRARPDAARRKRGPGM